MRCKQLPFDKLYEIMLYLDGQIKYNVANDKSEVEVHIMIFQMAGTSAYDKNEVEVSILAEKGETIRIGDIITIPMNDHTFEQREITAMYRDRKKWEKGKCLFSEIKEGEWAECIIHNIHSGMIHTISSPYDEDLLKDDWVCG